MKLFELVQVKAKRVRSINDFGDALKGRSDIKSGSYGYYYDDKSQHKMGVKYAYADYKNDAYFIYIRSLIKEKKLFSNPYFPRIYSVKLMKDSKGGEKGYRFEIEKLKPLEDLNPEEMSHIFEKFGGIKKWIEILAKDSSNTIYSENFYRNDSTAQAILLSKALKEFYNRNHRELVNDEQALEALDFIKKIVNTNGCYYDLHYGNIMVRRGPGGAQLVFTDPVA